MFDLEKEFDKLMRNVQTQIVEKRNAGELTSDEAELLTELLIARMKPEDDKLRYDERDDDGWRNSSIACGDAWSSSGAEKCW